MKRSGDWPLLLAHRAPQRAQAQPIRPSCDHNHAQFQPALACLPHPRNAHQGMHRHNARPTDTECALVRA